MHVFPACSIIVLATFSAVMGMRLLELPMADQEVYTNTALKCIQIQH